MRSRLEMSVTEALLVLRTCKTFEISLARLAFIVHLEHALTFDYCINAVMRKPTFDNSSSLPHGF